MFAKLARFRVTGKFLDPGPRRTAPRRVVLVHCNDIGIVRPVGAAAHRVERPVLMCHWQPATEGGRLECRWRIASVEGADAPELPDSRMDAPGIRRRLARRPRSTYRVKG
jgi:hypothetical protein